MGLKCRSRCEWCNTSYATDIETYMKEKEQCCTIQLQSPQLKYRSSLIQWLREVAEKLHLYRVTLHLAVHLLDQFMDNHNILHSTLPTFSIMCLIIAAKFEECESRVPRLCKVGKLVVESGVSETTVFTIGEIQRLETFILSWFDWCVGHPTAAHFAEYYALYAVLPGDRAPTASDPAALREAVKVSLLTYLDLSLSDVGLMRTRGSVVAASCILAARIKHQISPTWPQILVSVTNYSRSQLLICLTLLLRSESSLMAVGRKRKMDETIDQGYESASPNHQGKKRTLL